MKYIFCGLVFLLLFQLSYASSDINIAISATPNNLIPFYSTDANSQNINRLVHKSLIDFNENMEFECVSCEKFSSSVKNGKHYILFTLKSGLKFQDGTLLSTKDVEKSFYYFLKNEKIKSTFMDSMENFEKINIIDEHSFELVFSKYSLENLSNLGIIKILKFKIPDEKISDAITVNEIVGLGEYVIEKNDPLEIQLKSINQGKPKLVFKVVKDETTLALKLINQEIDLSVASMSARKINWLSSNYKRIKLHEHAGGNYMFMALNQLRPHLKDWRLRKALSLLIPRQDLLKYKFKNTVTLSNGMFSQSFPSMHTNREIDSFDSQLANKLIQEAGYKLNKNSLYEKDGKILRLDWKVSNNKSSIEIVETLKNLFKKNGIIIDMTVQEWGTYMSQFKAGNFDIVMGQWVGFNGPDMLRFVFHSENTPPKGGNRIRYKNVEFDKIIDQAISEPNIEKSIKLYQLADKIVTDDYAYVSLWHPNIVWLASECIKGIKLDSTGAFYSLPEIRKDCGYGK